MLGGNLGSLLYGDVSVISSWTVGYNMLLAYQESLQQCSVTLIKRDNKIVERAILDSGEWDPRFL